MSLEEALNENTAVLRELILALQNNPAVTSAAPVKKPAHSAMAAISSINFTPESVSETAVDSVKFETVRNLVLELAKANKREEVKKVNADHGIAKLSVLLKVETDYDSVIDQAKLEAVYADLQAIPL